MIFLMNSMVEERHEREPSGVAQEDYLAKLRRNSSMLAVPSM